MRAFAVILAVGVVGIGCDALFGIDRIDVETRNDASCGQPDEDGDCHRDRPEDGCPGRSDPAQLDGLDKDGVGTACDPDSSTAHDIAWFTGFNDPATDAPQWILLEGSSGWAFGQGEVVHASTDNGTELQQIDAWTAGELAVEAGFTFGAWRDQANTTRLGVWLAMPTGQRAGHHCAFTADGNSPILDELRLELDSGTSTVADIAELRPDDRIIMMLHRTGIGGTTLRCEARVNNGRAIALQIPAPPAAVGHIGLRSVFAQAEVRHVTVYTGR